MNSSKLSTNTLSKPTCFVIPKHTSVKNSTPMADLTSIIKDQEANIENLNLRLSKMEERTKAIEEALVGVDAIDHSVKVLEDKVWNQVDETIDDARKHQKSADALKKQKNMYRALGINPSSNGV